MTLLDCFTKKTSRDQAVQARYPWLVKKTAERSHNLRRGEAFPFSRQKKKVPWTPAHVPKFQNNLAFFLPGTDAVDNLI